MPHGNALNLDSNHNAAIRAEIGGFGFCSQKSSVAHHRAFNICSIA